MRNKFLIAAGGLVLVAGGVCVGILIHRAPPSELVLRQDAVWSSRIVSNRVVVPVGVTLTIQPGASVLFRPRAGLQVRGRLVAEGTVEQRIRLARERVPFYLWAGITFEDTQQDNRLVNVDIEAAGSEGQYIHLLRSRATIERARFFGAQKSVIVSVDSSLVLRGSLVDGIGENEVMRVLRTPVDGQFLVESNTFYPNFGYNDIADVTDCRSPGATPRFIGNTFLGGGDDGLDIDNSEAYIEGNIFVHFNLRGHKKYSDGISAGRQSRLVITNNLFAFNDQGVGLLGGTRGRLSNNTFYRNRDVAIAFKERSNTAGGAVIESCVFRQNGAILGFADVATELVISNSILPEADRWPGQGNASEGTTGGATVVYDGTY